MKLAKVSCSVLVTVGLCTLSPSTNAENNQELRIRSAKSTPYGMSYGEWGVAWWRWALGQPADVNPVTDTSGTFCGEGQTDSVWFLAGTFGGYAVRECTIPANRAIFFPVFTTLFGATVGDCEPTAEGECGINELRKGARQDINAGRTKDATLKVLIDGEPVEDVDSFRASSLEAFAITLPEGNILGLPEGTYQPHVTDGFWLFLDPLSAGEHLIEFTAYAPDIGFSLGVVYILTVDP